MKKRTVLLISIGTVLLIIGAVIFACALKLSPNGGVITEYDWNGYLDRDDEWYTSNEAKAIGDDILKYQLNDGGWRKDMANEELTDGSWAKSTLDNDTTTSQIRVLAKLYENTGKKKYLKACLKGIDLLLNGQYTNGGWPQVFDDAGTYHAHITYNDGAMVHVLYILKEVSEKSGDFSFVSDEYAEKAAVAVAKGIECILNTQIVVDGVKTAWCQQHDEFNLKPTNARAFEPADISASESVGIVNFLKSLPNKSDEIIESINSAIRWMDEVKIYGIKVVKTDDDRIVVEDPDAGPIWARFYQIGTNKPVFGDRDGSVHYDMMNISQERREGYSWYGSWPAKLVESGLMGE